MNTTDQNLMTESEYRPWNYKEWKELEGRTFCGLRLMIQEKIGLHLKDIQVADGQDQFVDFKLLSGNGKLSVQFLAIDSVAIAIDYGNKEPNWELRMADGTSIYLDSAT